MYYYWVSEAVAASRGAWGHFPLSRRLCPPLAPPVRKKWLKSATFGKFLDFYPLRIVFCPLDAPPQKKKNSGAATGLRCGLTLNAGMGISGRQLISFPPFYASPVIWTLICSTWLVFFYTSVWAKIILFASYYKNSQNVKNCKFIPNFSMNVSSSMCRPNACMKMSSLSQPNIDVSVSPHV